MRRRSLPILLLCVGLWSGRALADGQDPSAAGELFRQGLAAMERGDFETARANLEESERLDPAVGTLVRLAECEEHLGRLSSARGHLQRAGELARFNHDPRIDLVEKRFREIDQATPKLRFHLAGAPPDVTIQRDGTELRRGSLDVALPVDPGTHTIVASAPNKVSWTSTVETKAGSGVTTISIPALADQPASEVASVSAERASNAPATSMTADTTPARARVLPPYVTYAGFGVAAAGVIVGGIAGGLSLSSRAKLGTDCPDGHCGPSSQDELTSARRTALISDIAFAAAGVGLAVGVIGLVWRETPKSSTAAAGVMPVVGLGFAGCRGTF